MKEEVSLKRRHQCLKTEIDKSNNSINTFFNKHYYLEFHLPMGIVTSKPRITKLTTVDFARERERERLNLISYDSHMLERSSATSGMLMLV